jgi:ribosomal protein S18 acetylase RimI-like enzyme
MILDAMTTGVQIRRARVADARAIAEVHVRSSEQAYAPLARTWEPKSVSARASMWTTWLTDAEHGSSKHGFVGELGEAVIGFAVGGPPWMNELECDTEFRVAHVLPEHRGMGVGGGLWNALTAVLRGEKGIARSMGLRTFAELPSCDFYARRGGEVIARTPVDYHGGTVTEVLYRWTTGQSSAKDRYSLRPALESDFEFLRALKRDAYQEHVISTYGAWDETLFPANFTTEGVRIIIEGGERVGELAVSEQGGAWFLGAIELVSTRRGRGLGSQLLRQVLREADAAGTSLRLQVFKTNPAAKRLYTRLGFVPDGESETHFKLIWRGS